MKNKKSYQVALFVIACILLNYIGKLIAVTAQLPLWLDSIGTILVAYSMGPVCGAVIGVTVNILYGFSNTLSYIYAITNCAVGITIGLCAKKDMFKDTFNLLSTSFLTTIVCVVISSPLNIIFRNGRTGNIWGDGVIDYVKGFGWNDYVCYVVGEFYMDFLDKIVSVGIVCFFFKLIHFIKKRKKKPGLKKSVVKNSAVIFAVMIGLSATVNYIPVYGSEYSDEYVTESYVQTVYNSENSIIGGTVNDIAQTADGILWIGTNSGIYRYNGTEFKLMNEFESVKNVNCLYTDEEGRLWIGTNDSGLSISINESISNVINQDKGLPSDSVRCITKSANGDYYVGTTSYLAVITLSSGLVVSDVIEEVSYACSISADNNGNIAVVTNEGKLFIINGSEIILERTCNQVTHRYTACQFDRNGNLYVASDNGYIEYYEYKNNILKIILNNECKGILNINSLTAVDEKGVYVCADEGAGFFTSDGEFIKINTNKFASSIEHMLVDYQKNLWFTSSSFGLLKLSQTAFTDIYNQAGLDSCIVNSIVSHDDNLIFGTNKGITVIDEKNYYEVEHEMSAIVADDNINFMMVDSDNDLWIATDNSCAYQYTTTGEKLHYNVLNGALGGKFENIVELNDKTIVLASDSGLTFISDDEVTYTMGASQGLTNPKTLCLLSHPDGSLLAGTDGDGIYVIKDKQVVKTLRREDGLSSKIILRMIYDEKTKGTFIVTSNGLCYMDSNYNITHLDNFPYYNNYDIVINNDTCFILCSAGIYVADTNKLIENKEIEYELLNEKKGLSKSITPFCWNYVDDNGHLYLACDTGVLKVNLSDYNVTKRSYRMLLKQIIIDDERYNVERGEVIEIPNKSTRIEITPEIVNYTLNDPYVRVYLEGFDKKPKTMLQSELTSIVYTNLPTGEYTFHIAVLDSTGNEVVAESLHKIVKEKQIHENWWFRIYMIGIIIIAGGYIGWLFARTQVQRTLNLQKKELELAKEHVKLSNETILTIAKTVDAKDENTSQHSVRVSEYSIMIAKRLGYDEEQCENLKKTALLHDIGKIGIPDSVLKKPDRLTDDEYAIMKSHVIRGAEILKNFTLVDNVSEGALYHHERYDGRGYMHGLKGEEIPLNARIIGLADAFDAMTANRVYRKKLDFDFVLSEIEKNKGTQFDPKLVDIMLEIIKDGEIDINSIYNTNISKEAD